MAVAAQRPCVGRSVRAIRERQGLSQRVLAGRLGVSPGTLSAVESGSTSISVDRLCQIAAELGVSPSQLLDPVPAAVPDRGATVADRFPDRNWRQFAELAVDPALRGALTSFCRKGFHGASIREIAEAAGMSVPGLYHYHPSKQAMLVALLDLTMNELSWRVEAARAGVDEVDERLRVTVECLALYHARRPALAFIGASEMRSVDAADRTRIVLSRRRIQRMLNDDIAVLLGDLPDARPRTVTLGNAISTMCTSIAQWFDPSGAVSAEQLALLYADAACAMVQPPTRPTNQTTSRPTTGKAS